MDIMGYAGAKMTLEETAERRETVLIFPGGGYSWLSERESGPVARAFRSRGYRTAILYYDTASPVLGLTPVRQAAWAVAELKRRFPGEPVYLMGFSAGAHCAASLGVHWQDRAAFAPVGEYLDGSDLFRPDRMILAYPVITAGPYAHRGSFQRLGPPPEGLSPDWFSLETQVTERTPPAFLWQTAADDSVPVQNSLLFTEALLRASVPVELHIYPNGVHGLSLATQEVAQPERGRLPDPHVAGWFDAAVAWLQYAV